MPISAAAAANRILDASEERGLALDPMKLQKLIYLVNGYYAAMTGGAWVNEAFQAWKYGPVLPSIYRTFKQFGSHPIKPGTRANSYSMFAGMDNEPVATRVMNYVLDRYGAKSGIYLSELTHKLGSPWDKARAIGWNAEIPTEAIIEHYSPLVPQPANA